MNRVWSRKRHIPIVGLSVLLKASFSLLTRSRHVFFLCGCLARFPADPPFLQRRPSSSSSRRFLFVFNVLLGIYLQSDSAPFPLILLILLSLSRPFSLSVLPSYFSASHPDLLMVPVRLSVNFVFAPSFSPHANSHERTSKDSPRPDSHYLLSTKVLRTETEAPIMAMTTPSAVMPLFSNTSRFTAAVSTTSPLLTLAAIVLMKISAGKI